MAIFISGNIFNTLTIFYLRADAIQYLLFILLLAIKASYVPLSDFTSLCYWGWVFSDFIERKATFWLPQSPIRAISLHSIKSVGIARLWGHGMSRYAKSSNYATSRKSQLLSFSMLCAVTIHLIGCFGFLHSKHSHLIKHLSPQWCFNWASS